MTACEIVEASIDMYKETRRMRACHKIPQNKRIHIVIEPRNLHLFHHAITSTSLLMRMMKASKLTIIMSDSVIAELDELQRKQIKKENAK